ncbi:MAG: hypothetical protein ACOCVG_05420 [Verrucomicrobiota bacterium]
MSAPKFSTEAVVLDRAEHGEHFLKLSVLSPEEGLLVCLRRMSRKQPGTQPDLFDELALDLERKGGGGPAFVREVEILRRREAIGQSYRALEAAGALSRVVLRNAVHIEDLPSLHALVVRALDCWAHGEPPQAVLLKTLFLLVRSEGYPVAEDWLPRLEPDLREAAVTTLQTPLKDLQIDPKMQKSLAQSFEDWMRHNTDFIL